MTNPRHAQFARIALFQELEVAEIESLCQSAAQKQYAAGDLLFQEGEACEGLYLLSAGVVKIFKSSASGRQITLGMQPAPSTVAEVPLFDGGPFPASVQAVTPVSALFLQKRAFHLVCLNNPAFALKLLAVVGRRLRGLISLVEKVTFGSIRQRIAQTILQWADQAGGQRFEPPQTHQELALHLGTVREVISRNLSRFQAEGLIRFSRREIELLNLQGLRDEAETEY